MSAWQHTSRTEPGSVLLLILGPACQVAGILTVVIKLSRSRRDAKKLGSANPQRTRRSQRLRSARRPRSDTRQSVAGEPLARGGGSPARRRRWAGHGERRVVRLPGAGWPLNRPTPTAPNVDNGADHRIREEPDVDDR